MPKVLRGVPIRVPVQIPLAHVASETEPGTFHVIALDENNTVFCSCPAWQHLGHRCKRLAKFRKALTKAA
jgi:hypothetical protein